MSKPCKRLCAERRSRLRERIALIAVLVLMTGAAIFTSMRLRCAVQMADFYRWQLTNAVFTVPTK